MQQLKFVPNIKQLEAHELHCLEFYFIKNM